MWIEPENISHHKAYLELKKAIASQLIPRKYFLGQLIAMASPDMVDLFLLLITFH